MDTQMHDKNQEEIFYSDCFLVLIIIPIPSKIVFLVYDI